MFACLESQNFLLSQSYYVRQFVSVKFKRKLAKMLVFFLPFLLIIYE